MKNQWLTVILSLCCSLFLQAQYWEVTPFRGGAEDVIEHPSGFFMGTGADTDDGAAVAFRLNAEGEVVWRINLDGRIGHGICQWSNDEFVIFGTKNDLNPADTSGTIFVSKITIEGDILWQRHYNLYFESQSDEILRTHDGNLIISGYYTKPAVSNGFNYLMKLDALGEPIFKREFATPLAGPREVLALPSGEILIGSFDSQSELTRLDADGNVLEDFSFDQDEGMTPIHLLSEQQGHIVTLSDNFNRRLHFTRMTEQGEVIASHNIEKLIINGSNDGTALVDGTYAIGGYWWDTQQAQADIFVVKLDENGQVLWDRTYGRQSNGNFSQEYFGHIRGTADGGLILCGGSDGMAFIVKTDLHGNSLPNFVQGQVFQDVDGNCEAGTGDVNMSNWVVQAVGLPGVYYGVTDEEGAYEINLPAGVFEISVVPLSPYWGTSCLASKIISLGAADDIQTVDLPVEAIVSCPIIDVSIVSDRLRRCFPSTYEVDYCNTGTVAATEGYIELTLDPFLTLDSAEVAYSQVTDFIYRFEVGTLEVGACGQFSMFTTLACDLSIPVGQVHCVEANGYPDTFCLADNQTWDGAIIEVDGYCQSDTVFFSIRNVGTSDMAGPLSYIVIEDQIILHERTFQLAQGEELVDTIPGMGSAYTLIARQSPGGPGNPFPNVTVTNCGDGTTVLQLQWPENDNGPSHDVHCLENVDSYDPNDKQGAPKGWGSEKLILPNTPLEYKIRFQNTGTDTAYTVLIKDRIPSALDIKTLRPAASSHPYSWSINDGEYLTFKFDDIRLPDSTTNSAASQGFVNFTIEQKQDLPLGTNIQNTAAIYFDFNPPIYTNTTQHQVGNFFNSLPTNTQEKPRPTVEVLIFPNPMRDQAFFQVQGLPSQPIQLQLFDLAGQLVRRESYENIQFTFSRGHLSTGLYVYSLRLENGQVLQGKLALL